MTTTEAELAAKIQPYITIDDSGLDADLLEIRGKDGQPRKVLFRIALYDMIDAGQAFLPDGTPIDRESLQIAFQNALIKNTGRCVLEEEYHRAGHPDLAAVVRSARGAGEP